MTYDYGNWLLVIAISTIFLLFLFDAFKPKTGTDWRTYGSFAAFIVALFAEMYGFPLTIYLLTAWFGTKLPQLNTSHNSGHLWETLLGNTGNPHISMLHIISNVSLVGGVLLIGAAWNILYAAAKNRTLATTGPYQYIRHPQYAGFILIIIGFLLQWPTIPTLLMAPFLIWRYVKLAHGEEHRVSSIYPLYTAYRFKTPAWIPSFYTLWQLIMHTGKGGDQHDKK